MKNDHLKSRFEEEFIEHSPPSGHEARFMKKLAKESIPIKGRSNLSLWTGGITAAAILIILSVFTINQMKKDNQMTARFELQQLNPKAAESQQVLLEKVLLKSSKIDLYAPELKGELSELRRLEAEYQKLDSLFQQSIVNEQLIQGLITNYGHRLRVLEQMSKKLQYLKKQHQLKAIENEKV
ncbi:MAG: hypothetical protein ACPGED_05310 [Flavobacteriales bacterium]